MRRQGYGGCQQQSLRASIGHGGSAAKGSMAEAAEALVNMLLSDWLAKAIEE